MCAFMWEVMQSEKSICCQGAFDFYRFPLISRPLEYFNTSQARRSVSCSILQQLLTFRSELISVTGEYSAGQKSQWSGKRQLSIKWWFWGSGGSAPTMITVCEKLLNSFKYMSYSALYIHISFWQLWKCQKTVKSVKHYVFKLDMSAAYFISIWIYVNIYSDQYQRCHKVFNLLICNDVQQVGPQ